MHRPVTPNHLGASRLALALSLAWPLLGQAQGPICHCFQIAPVLPPTDSDIEFTPSIDAAPAAPPLLTSAVVVQPDSQIAKPVLSSGSASQSLAALPAPAEDTKNLAQSIPVATTPVIAAPAIPTSVLLATAADRLAPGKQPVAKSQLPAPAQMNKVLYQPSAKSAHELVEALIPPTDTTLSADTPVIAVHASNAAESQAPQAEFDAAEAVAMAVPTAPTSGTDPVVAPAENPIPSNLPSVAPDLLLLVNREVVKAEEPVLMDGPIDGPSLPPRPAELEALANKEVAQPDSPVPSDGPAAPPEPREPVLVNQEVETAQLALPLSGPAAPPEPPATPDATGQTAQTVSDIPVDVAAAKPHSSGSPDGADSATAAPIEPNAVLPPQHQSRNIAQVQLSLPFADPAETAAPAGDKPLAPEPEGSEQVAQAQLALPVDSGAAASPPASTDNNIELRRPTGAPPIQEVIPEIDPSQVPPPTPLLPRESLPLPDRWRIVETLGIKDDPFNPYAQNLLKGDKPIPAGFGLGPDWFINLGLISDTLLETHNIPTPISSSGVINPSAVDQLGRGTQSIFNQTFLFSASLIKGDTTFKPPDYELRIVPAFNGNIVHAEESGALEANPAAGLTRRDSFAGLQEAYFETHLRNVSDRYDFDSVRIGIQPFTSDFRGFVFQDDALGIRFFGNRDNNTWQYNLAWLQRIEKDTNSGLNDIAAPLRKDTTFIANLYHQDFPIQGNTTQLTVMHNINHDDDQYVDADGFQTRPAEVGDGEAHKYNVTYVGLNTDGHFGRWNLTSSFYGAFGHDSHNPIAQRAQTIQAGFAAAELSRDFDWIRIRASAVYATGDRNVNDNKSTGFDAILENPDIAGAGTSFWIRQAIPLIGGGGVALNGRDGLLPALRSSKDDGQSNFVNPGLILLGMGADADITPNLRVLANFSHLSFDSTAVLEALRAQGNISRDIGWDLSTALQYRPFLTQNMVFSASLATLIPGDGFKELYNTQRLGLPYSILFNMVLRY